MSIRFVVGRAGSGKTWRCLEAIRKRLRENAATGNKLLLLVPEQASFQMERAFIETPDIPGYIRCEVLSFQRLAYRIFTETGADPRRADQTIGPLGRLMVIRRLIRRERPALRLLNRVADKPGLIKRVAVTLNELMRENVDPQLLADLAQQSERDNPLQSAKLADVTRLYCAYLDYLIDDRVDPAQYLNLAAERLSECDWLSGAEVWVDGFAGFTSQEYYLLTKLAGHVAGMEITMLVDPSASAIEADELPAESYSLFTRTERTLVRLRREFKSAGIELDEPIHLPSQTAPRFNEPLLARLERYLFNSPPESNTGPPVPEVIRVVELPDRRSEIQAAVDEVLRLTRESHPPMRYRDIAIIVRDLTVYHDLISAAMGAHGIPCFIDRRQPTTHHPLIELIRGLLSVATDDCRLESVRLTLKTGLMNINDDDADLLENYLLAHGINGRGAWDQLWHYTRFFDRKLNGPQLSQTQQETLDRVNDIRRKWLETLRPWLSFLADHAENPGRAWAQALFDCLDQMQVGQRLTTWADAAEGDGLSDQADMHRQIWSDFVELIDEFVKALGTELMRVNEFRETIEAALAEFDLGLAPPTLDQVLVGAIERSRHPTIRAALILGFDEHHFPQKRSEDPLLGDAEREALESAGAEIGPPRRRQLLDERMLAYIALTRASERLWISYPRAETDGRPLQPSPYLDDVLAALPGLCVEKIGDPQINRSPLWITRVGDLGGRLAAEFRYRPDISEDPEPQRRAIFNALYEQARQCDDWRYTLGRSLAGLKYKNAAGLEPAMMDRAVSIPFAASVSRLERFAACPFAHFADYMLDLRPRVRADLAEVDLGTLCHVILEKFIDQLAHQRQSLADLQDDDITERIDAIAAQIVPELADDMMLADARNAFLVNRSRGHLHRVTRWQRDAARLGRYRPLAVEYPFGFSGDSAAPLTLTTPGGRTILLRGKIDRIDVAELGNELLGAVIDYKRTTERTLDLAKVYHGITLQLVGYLLALKQTGESLTGRPIRPVAAFYLPLLEPYQTVTHPSREKKTRYQWRGIADLAALNTLDNTVEPGGQSRFLSARLKKSGEPYADSDLAESNQLTSLMRHVGRRMGQLADDLLDGNVAVAPYRLRRQTPCTYCEYRAVCRYEIETQPPRLLESLDKAQVLKLVGEGNAHA